MILTSSLTLRRKRAQFPSEPLSSQIESLRLGMGGAAFSVSEDVVPVEVFEREQVVEGVNEDVHGEDSEVEGIEGDADAKDG